MTNRLHDELLDRCIDTLGICLDIALRIWVRMMYLFFERFVSSLDKGDAKILQLTHLQLTLSLELLGQGKVCED